MTKRPQILVVGDVMLDRYWFGRTSRVSPEAPVPVVDVDREQTRLGGAANVANNLAALGVGTRLLGLIGDDAAGDALLALASRQGIDIDCVRGKALATVVKQRVISRNQQLVRADFEPAGRESRGQDECAAELIRRAVAALSSSSFDAVICSDYAKGALVDPQPLIEAARRCGVPVIVDPKSGDWQRYHGATVMTPNLAELRTAIGDWRDEAGLTAGVAAARDRYQIETVVLTRSGEGLSVYGEHQPVHLAAVAREVFDVTGAGDTVTAVLAFGMAQRLGVADAAECANRAAGIVVAKLGTATVTPSELQTPATTEHGAVLDRAGLLDWVDERRAAGERIVFTNGCFDLLHPGHIDCLTRAGALGDRLVVAVNDDASVRALKGQDRPIQPLSDRMAMLRALAVVDQVVAFDTPTPAALIEAVAPDVLVKGGDYTADEIAGSDAVRAAGGSVVVMEILPGHASREIIRRIRDVGPSDTVTE